MVGLQCRVQCPKERGCSENDKEREKKTIGIATENAHSQLYDDEISTKWPIRGAEWQGCIGTVTAVKDTDGTLMTDDVG